MAAVALAVLSGSSLAAVAQEDIETSDSGVICASPHNVRDGYLAAWSMNGVLLQQLKCIHVLPGIGATLLDNNDVARTWRVRIALPNGRTVTAYGWPCGFRTKGSREAFPCAEVPTN